MFFVIRSRGSKRREFMFPRIWVHSSNFEYLIVFLIVKHFFRRLFVYHQAFPMIWSDISVSLSSEMCDFMKLRVANNKHFTFTRLNLWPTSNERGVRIYEKENFFTASWALVWCCTQDDRKWTNRKSSHRTVNIKCLKKNSWNISCKTLFCAFAFKQFFSEIYVNYLTTTKFFRSLVDYVKFYKEFNSLFLFSLCLNLTAFASLGSCRVKLPS